MTKNKAGNQTEIPDTLSTLDTSTGSTVSEPTPLSSGLCGEIVRAIDAAVPVG